MIQYFIIFFTKSFVKPCRDDHARSRDENEAKSVLWDVTGVRRPSVRAVTLVAAEALRALCDLKTLPFAK